MQISATDEKNALAAVATHPLCVEALAWPHCTVDVSVEVREFVERTRLAGEVKTQIFAALGKTETVLLVSYMTSAQETAPLSGGGSHYFFFVHPESYSILHSRKGTWRA